MVYQHGLGLGYVPVPDDAVKPPKAPAMRFRDWLITHNWSLHRAGLFLLALSCLVRSFTRGDAAVDGLDVVFVASYTLLGAFLARTYLDPKGYRAAYETHVLVAELVSTLALHLDDPARRTGGGALTWALIPMSAVLASISLRFEFRKQAGWHLVINVAAHVARELVAAKARGRTPGQGSSMSEELLSVMHRYNSALATAIAMFGHYYIEQNEIALYAAHAPSHGPAAVPDGAGKKAPHRQRSSHVVRAARRFVPASVRAMNRDQWSNLTSSAVLVIGILGLSRQMLQGASVLTSAIKAGTLMGTLRGMTGCEAAQAVQPLGLLMVLREIVVAWGRPKGRAAYVLHARRARSRQMVGLLVACAPYTLAHLAGCGKHLSITRGSNPAAELAKRCVVWVFFGVIYSHAIVYASALPFAIIALNKAGGHVATMGSLRAVADDFPSLVVEIVPPATVAAVVARLVNWRASRLYMSR